MKRWIQRLRKKSNRSMRGGANRRKLLFQSLETRQVLAAGPVITEFVASNSSSLEDGFGDDSDWIEIYNDSDAAVDLVGYHLTDKASDLTQWEFPTSTPLNAGEYLVVFASKRDTVDPSGYHHTNFKLSGGGEYVALTAPDQSVLSEFGQGGSDYPPQMTDISYGAAGASLVTGDSVAQYLIPQNNTLGLTWTANDFDAVGNEFSQGRAAIGYEDPVGAANGYQDVFETEVPAGTTNLYLRTKFTVADASAAIDLQLRVNFDDGFAAYLNGTPVASFNAPSPLEYDTPASGQHGDAEARAGNTFNLDSFVGDLVDGENTLAIHALNRAVSSDFLIVPELSSQSITGGVGYLRTPTPGAANASILDLGPLVEDVEFSPVVATENQPLTITASVSQFNHPVVASSVQLNYRIMYGPEVTLSMVDDGSGNDAIAADGIFTATIPSSSFSAGEMVRWYATADDTLGVETRAPRFLDPLDSAEYFGTVVEDASITTDLPLMQWFVQDPAAASTDEGTRGSLFFNGEFLDNIQTDNHGQSTRGSAFPKKSFDFDANSGNKFLIKEGVDRASDFNLLTNYADQSKLRNSLAYDAFAKADFAHHLAFSVTVYRNGAFYGLYDLVEEGDTEYLERLGLDSDNPLYKVNNNLDDAYENVEKKSREYEDHSDFEAVVTAAQNLTGDAALDWDFDHIDIADMVNYLAIQNVISSTDFGQKNMYWYRDTNDTGLWSALPWDQDLSLGHKFNSNVDPSYFDNALIVDQTPYVGGNKVFRRLFADSTFREMHERRVRSLSDQFYGLPGTPVSESYLAGEIVRLEGLIADEALQDTAKWGIHPNFSSVYPETPLEAAEQLISGYIAGRRSYLDSRGGIPDSQVANPVVRFDDVDFDADPISGLQTEEYVRLNNPGTTAVDISGWRLGGGVEHRFKGGTVIPAGDALYVVKDVVAFQNRSTGPSGGQRLFIQGNYQGQLTFTGETVDLINPSGTVVDTLTTPTGTPTANQLYLRVTEVQYNPTANNAEFIELTNISSGAVATTLDLSGVSITDGPSDPYVFPAGTTLGPSQRLVVVQDLAAFALAHPGVSLASVFGPYAGKLSNGGERIKIVDAGSETIFDLEYDDSDPWPIAADGGGASLELIDESGTPSQQLGKYYRWQASEIVGGTPTTNSPAHAVIVINEVLAHTDDPFSDSIELYNPSTSPLNIGGWYLSDSSNELQKYQIPSGTFIAALGYLVFDESHFNPNPQAPGPNDFGLNAAEGDEVWLSQSSGGVVTKIHDAVAFAATFNNESLGRIPDGIGRLAPLMAKSLGGANGDSSFGALTISEVHYHPGDPSAAAIAAYATVTASDLEFIEIHNPGSKSIDLTNWRLRGQADLDLPATTLAAGQSMVAVPFDPTNIELVAAFNANYGVSGLNLIGPWTGELSNSFGRITLQHPDSPPADDPTLVPRITVDEVLYDDLSPWADADGSGSSLNRTATTHYGNAPASWTSNSPTPGTSSLVRQPMDFGDAPSPYPTLLVSRGAYHQPTGPRLGDLRDAELDGQIAGQSVGDDANGTDDEDGVFFGGITPNTASGVNMAAVNIDLQNASSAKVDAWIDFNGDGDWEDEGEQILHNAAVQLGLQTLNYPLPAGVGAGETFARVRVSSTGDLAATGPAIDGEVEDYRVTIGPPQVEEILINGGQEQRSSLETVRVLFDREVDIDNSSGDVFQFVNVDTGLAVTDIPATERLVDGKTVLDFTFDPTDSSVTGSGSLQDAAYRLVIVADRITSFGVPLVGNGGGISGDDYLFGDSDPVDKFFRRYGDIDGSDSVGLADFAVFRASFGKSQGDVGYQPGFDADDDNQIGLSDFAAFRAAFGQS